jgi:7-cyano-7-deazaguanine synthase
MKKESCVVVLSGGLDSSTVAYWAVREGYRCHALTLKYGQIASKEIESAVKIAENLGITLTTIDLSDLSKIFTGISSLCDATIPMTSSFSQPIIVPFRNAIFLSIAVAYAVSIGAEKIFYGAHGADVAFYPDCRRDFYKAFEAAARLGTEQAITIDAPFVAQSKASVLKTGMALGVPYELTWSCYLNGENHCGACESCNNRKNAFMDAKIRDPTPYLK